MTAKFKIKRLVRANRADRVQRRNDVTFFYTSFAQFAIDRCKAMLMLDDYQLSIILERTGKKDFTGLYSPDGFAGFSLYTDAVGDQKLLKLLRILFAEVLGDDPFSWPRQRSL